MVLLCVAALGVAWVVVTGLLARSDLQRVRSDLPGLRAALVAGDTTRAASLAGDLGRRTARAEALVSGPAWWVASNLPVVGAPLQTTRAVAAAADSIGAHVAPGLVTLTDTLRHKALSSTTALDLPALAAAQPVVDNAATVCAKALRTVRGTRSSTWLSSVDDARTQLLGKLAQVAGDLAGARRALALALPMLGQHGPRTYFVAFENEAEMRGIGGLPGAFAIVTANDGSLRFTHFGNDTEFGGVHTNVQLGKEFDARYGTSEPTAVFSNSDISPDFRDAARIWAAMWHKRSGQRVDGALAVDSTALSYLLQVTGPATLPDGSSVSASTVVSVTQQGEYSRYPDVPARKKFVVAVSKAISRRLTTAHVNPLRLVRALGEAARQRRLLIWSDRRTEEAGLMAARYAGALDAGTRAYTGFVVVNAAGSKLDYYLDRRMTYRRPACGAAGTSTAALILHNDAPRSRLPSYVTIRADRPSYRTRPGDNLVIVTYYATAGSHPLSANLDGHAVQAVVGTEDGLTTVSAGVELPVGSTRTLTIQLAEPRAHLPIEVLAQPGVRPITTDVDGGRC